MGPARLELATYGLKAPSLTEYTRVVTPKVGSAVGTKSGEVLRAIARRAPDAAELAEAFARELLEADDDAMAARASMVVRAFDIGDARALDRAIDLFERLLDGASARAARIA